LIARSGGSGPSAPRRANPLGLLCFWFLAVALFSGFTTCVQAQGSQARLRTAYGQLPLAFEINQGQSDPRVIFLCRGSGYGLFLTGSDTVLTLTRAEPKTVKGADNHVASEVLRFKLLGAQARPQVEGMEPLPGKSNYFIGNDQKKWRTDVPQYARVKSAQVYPGIDLVYYGRQRQLEYDFQVAPGADPGAIRFTIDGAQKGTLNAHGDLVLQTPGGSVIEQAPLIYQQVDGRRETIGGGYEVRRVATGGSNTTQSLAVSFRVASYDHARPLVIDPVLTYSTYLGGSDFDQCYGIALDGSGNAYITGETFSSNFPTTSTAYQTSLTSSFAQAFVTKLNATGSGLVYSTYIGGNDGDAATAIAVDGSGKAYITGETSSSNFPTTTGAFQTGLPAGPNGGEAISPFVTELNSTGSGLVYSTFLGGTGQDEGNGIAVDGTGSAYVTGYTSSSSFPTTTGAFQTSIGGSNAYNAFVTKLTITGTGLVYSTYLGGNSYDAGQGIAVDGGGDAYVTGYANSSNFPTTASAFQTSLGGSGIQNAFVTEVNPTGSALIYSTYLGGSSYDEGYGIAVDGSLNAYVTGGASSQNFPTTNGAFQTTIDATSSGNAFVTKVNAAGSALVYSTYLGGNAGDQGKGIALDSSGDAYVTGYTSSQNFPTASAFQAVLGGTAQNLTNAFVTELNATGTSLVYSSYLGGSGNGGRFGSGDSGSGIAVDAYGDAYVAGSTDSSNFPTTAGAYKTALGASGAQNAFVAEVGLGGYVVTVSAGVNGAISPNTTQIVSSGSSIAFTATPATGYEVNQWLVNGSAAQTGGNTFNLNNITANAAVQVTFVQLPNTALVTASAGPNGGISPNTSQAVDTGGSVSFTATPASGYVVNQWLANGTVAQTGGTNYTLADVTANTAVQVTFVPAEFFFTASSTEVQNTDGQVTVTVSSDFPGPASVNYQTVDETGTAGVEYTGTQGTLFFAASQTQATITVPIIQDSSAPGSTDFSIQLSDPSTGAIIGAPGSINVTILNALAGDLNTSQPTFTLPGTAPGSTGSITVDLFPSGVGQWKLFGEVNWRDSGGTATGLSAGNYEVESSPVEGYQQPDVLVVPLLAGVQAVVSGTYTVNGSPSTGSLQVTLAVPQGSGTGGWRIQGQTNWLPSGYTATSLNTGDYVLEFEPITGLATPADSEAIVYSGSVATLNITYLVGDSTIGLPPALVSGTIAQTQAPYVFTGEIQTDEGFGTGFVPMDRVVLTAAHVLFDDTTLSYIPGVQWFFQYESGVFEAPAQIPIGSYVLSGYAAQRASDIASGISPGVATTASRELDAAALYFFEPAARGGQSGYLGSDSATNPWLTGALDKFIAGYPIVNGTTGFLYATPVVQNAFQNVAGTLLSTTAITSYPGNSGGPLFVQYSDGNYYPAAIYLGGSEETIVHAIDSDVIALMTAAEVSGNGGANNSSGGITQVANDESTGATAYAVGSVNVTLSPPGAVSDGAYWEIGDGVKRLSGQSAVGLPPGSYMVTFFTSGVGYSAPAPMQVSVAAGVGTPVTGAYTARAPTITSGTQATVIEGQPFNFPISVTPNATGYAVTSGALPRGLTLDGTTGVISGTVPFGVTTGPIYVSLQATNNQGPGNALTLALTVAQPGQLTVSTIGKGAVSKALARPSIQAVGSSISIQATPAAGYVFAYWSDARTGAVLSTQLTYKFTMPTLLDLQANFVANPFLTAAGSYVALLQGGSYAESGFAQIAVATNGSFNAIFTLGGSATKPVHNAFNTQGQYQGEFEIPGGGLYNATLSLTASAVLTGTLTSQSDGSQIALSAERPATRSDAGVAGAYTVVLPAPPGGNASLPGGNGYGTLTVSKTGAVNFAGKIGDGIPVTLAGSLDGNRIWHFLYVKPASRITYGELLLGSVAFPPAASGTAGVLNWYRTASVNNPYPAGFATSVPFVTGTYAPPALSATSAQVTFSGADAFPSVTKSVTVAVKGKTDTATNVGVNTGSNRFFLNFAPTTGLFSGTFVDNSVTRVFTGAVLKSGSSGMGLFQDATGQTGSVVIQESP